ncbi:unnamed protein product, partial [Closterium sp. NIES-65]
MAAWHGGAPHVPAALQRQTLIPSSACGRIPSMCTRARYRASAFSRACVPAGNRIARLESPSPVNALNASRFYHGSERGWQDFHHRFRIAPL